MQIDPRLNAFRPDIADQRLAGQVEAETYIEGEAATIIIPKATLRARPDDSASISTQAVYGDAIRIFEKTDHWAWGQLEKDSYVGYLPIDALGEKTANPTHRVCTPATFIYPQADMKSQPATRIFLNSLLVIKDISDNWAAIADGGFVYYPHISAIDEFATDPVAIAEQFLHAPYLWGGCTLDGLDCSALVQQSYHACGLKCPRDSDMIEAGIGKPGHNSPRRGDLVFWDGHVGMMVDEHRMIHANGYHMAVAIEEFSGAETRIGREYASKARFNSADS